MILSTTRGQCNYNERLADNTRSNEIFTFETKDRGLGMLKKMLFGFGKTVGDQAGMGTLGLMLGELSIVKSFYGKLSISIGNIYNIFSRKPLSRLRK